MRYASISVTNTTPSVFGVAGSSVERVRLTALAITANTTVTVQFQSSTGNTALSGAMTLVAGVPLVLPASPHSPGSGQRPGYLQTAYGDGLQITLGAANCAVNGFANYVYVTE